MRNLKAPLSGSFTGDLARCVKEALQVGSSLHRGTAGEHVEVRLLGLLREKENANLGSSSVDPEDTKS